MQIHREHAIHARGVQQIRHELRCDRHAWLIFAVLARVSKKWNDSRDPDPRLRVPRLVTMIRNSIKWLLGRRAGRLAGQVKTRQSARECSTSILTYGLAVGKTELISRLSQGHARCTCKFARPNHWFAEAG
jgi:hypothetical protein